MGERATPDPRVEIIAEILSPSWTGTTDGARSTAERIVAALDASDNRTSGEEWAGFYEAATWYVRCLEDVQARKPVRGLDEAKLGYERAQSRVHVPAEKPALSGEEQPGTGDREGTMSTTCPARPVGGGGDRLPRAREINEWLDAVPEGWKLDGFKLEADGPPPSSARGRIEIVRAVPQERKNDEA